ncbi:hypothetical protein HanRHA438_Chr11g0511991 [Helianthus annuus]|nr:hypothetical protein HanHA300_Chr11g0409811 [Helianthus annuus]KAJ0518104.1 hypothetical protein HanHA89_Chr11g0433491 [Helianthus annuus]KAJ0686130.1 hypothetical protein HanLR1_Chr11g0411091 [Helianthus annuus]KAJ0689976.1 hypothetical protein HanOQP8_Chr11g0412441 [Helianthus annuus]KAJ0871409.1 hypothetical protein HanRHA438_Chr11g0511991 [Helianthus annuus]
MFAQESSDTYLITHKSHMTFKNNESQDSSNKADNNVYISLQDTTNKFQQNTKSHDLHLEHTSHTREQIQCCKNIQKTTLTVLLIKIVSHTARLTKQ